MEPVSFFLRGDKSEAPSIVPGHAYTLLSACEANGVKLLRLRNPWGDHEWTGDWSDKSNLNSIQIESSMGQKKGISKEQGVWAWSGGRACNHSWAL